MGIVDGRSSKDLALAMLVAFGRMNIGQGKTSERSHVYSLDAIGETHDPIGVVFFGITMVLEPPSNFGQKVFGILFAFWLNLRPLQMA